MLSIFIITYNNKNYNYDHINFKIFDGHFDWVLGMSENKSS